MVLFELVSYKFSIHSLTIAFYFLSLAEVQPVKFSSDSFLVLQFKDSYRREQQRKERESNSARKRRAVSSSREEFSIRFRTRNVNGPLLLASDSTTTLVSGYTVLEVNPIATLTLSLSRVPCGTKYHYVFNIWSILSNLNSKKVLDRFVI